ncbi:MAG: Txe/YoeB family addiction module toxin [Candidatus Peribacteraceae bacterium]|nr:Txe/YoeB family addiction module toxin [Candidatus Peribacteraceae bacterium]
MDYIWWEGNDKKKFIRIQKLINAIKENPCKGIGKPEPLKFDLQGYWFRRIDQQNRLVYKVENSVVTVISCRYYY